MSIISGNFLKDLKTNVLVADGAMGTALLTRGFLPPLEAVNLTDPQVVTTLHREYFLAGARVIFTNTFGANEIRLKLQNPLLDLNEVNRAAVQNARAAIGQEAYVVASLGPSGLSLAELYATPLERLKQNTTHQMRTLSGSAVDAYAFETVTSLVELKPALDGCLRAKPEPKPLLVFMSVGPDGVLADGTPLATWAKFLRSQPVDVVGVNCGVGPNAMGPVLRELGELTGKSVAFKPSAGLPDLQGPNSYPFAPKDFSEAVLREIPSCVRLIGGCCGTTAEFIGALVAELSHHTTL